MTEIKEIKNGVISHKVIYVGEEQSFNDVMLHIHGGVKILVNDEEFITKDAYISRYRELQNEKTFSKELYEKIIERIETLLEKNVISDFYQAEAPYLFKVYVD
jgi:hypothetical protein